MQKIKVKFIKDVSGIEKGTIKNLPVSTANACVKNGSAEFFKAAPKKKATEKK